MREQAVLPYSRKYICHIIRVVQLILWILWTLDFLSQIIYVKEAISLR